MKAKLLFAKQNVEVSARLNETELEVRVLERHFHGTLLRRAGNEFVLETKDGVVRGRVFRGKDYADVHTPKGTFRFVVPRAVRAGAAAHAPGSLASPMPGKVLKVLVKSGEKVKAGDTLIVLEAMKMEHKVLSPFSGRVRKVFYREGDRVVQEVELLEIEES